MSFIAFIESDSFSWKEKSGFCNDANFSRFIFDLDIAEQCKIVDVVSSHTQNTKRFLFKENTDGLMIFECESFRIYFKDDGR